MFLILSSISGVTARQENSLLLSRAPYSIQQFKYNTSIQVKYINSSTVHQFKYNTSIQVQYINSSTVHQDKYNTLIQVKYIN